MAEHGDILVLRDACNCDALPFSSTSSTPQVIAGVSNCKAVNILQLVTRTTKACRSHAMTTKRLFGYKSMRKGV
jgi:hypothetical protein